MTTEVDYRKTVLGIPYTRLGKNRIQITFSFRRYNVTAAFVATRLFTLKMGSQFEGNWLRSVMGRYQNFNLERRTRINYSSVR